MFVSKVTYSGNLRTESVHMSSGNGLTTDAPVDNQGKGEAFSPTDLVATSLAACMFTVMGIACQTHGMNIDGSSAEVTKIMASNPRRISEIHINLTIIDRGLSQKSRAILEHTARTCPVWLSLSADLIKNVSFQFEPIEAQP